MRIYKNALSISLALAFAAAPILSAAAQDTQGQVSADEEQTLSLFAKGPGVTNLSLGDEFAEYQWGLKNDGEFKLVELQNKFAYIESGRTTDGPDLRQTAVTKARSGVDVNVRPAWDLYNQSQNKRSVIVAVIDTGVDISHQDLKDSIWVNEDEIPGDGIDNDGNGFVDDVNGWNFFNNSNSVFTGAEDTHGTHAAGTIAADQGSFGIAGIANSHYVKIMPVKALGGTLGAGRPSAVIQAIQYAEANGATICNLSLGSAKYDEGLAQAIKNSKMLFVIAAGNGDVTGIGYNTDISPVYPASLPYDNVISVANLLFDGTLSASSNYGAASVDIAAPGSYIVSTVPDNQYAFMTGTSMAAPMVTGAAAMLYSYFPDISLQDVRTRILTSAKKLGSLNGKVATGGVLDIYASMTYNN